MVSLKRISAARLTIHQKPSFPDLHVEPVHRDGQLGGQFGRGRHIGVVGPSGAWMTHLHADGMPDSLNRDREDLATRSE